MQARKRGNIDLLTPALRAELDALAAMPESEIDTSEMPPITDWSQAIRRSTPESAGGHVREKLARYGLKEQDVAAALKWSRS
jgi:hypothetical protein